MKPRNKTDICAVEGCNNGRSTKPIQATTKNRLQYNSPFCAKCNNLHYRYGLNLKTRQEMLDSQGRGCKICRKPIEFFEEFTGKHSTENQAVIDHCHETGKVRGILCNKCNRGLGHFNDDLNLFAAAMEYLNDL